MASDTGTSTESPLSVSDYLEEVAVTLAGEFGRSSQRWIRGELTKDPYEKRHLYLDVKDASGAEALLRAKCWESVWSPIKARLREQGVTLKAGTVINFLGYLDVYKPRGEMSVTITRIDVDAMLGDAALKLAEMIKKLTVEGVLAANKERVVPELPLRIGLVASPQTEGYKDFLGQLDRSGLAFDVTVVPTTVQGDSAPPAIVNAIETLDTLSLDLICVIRGGGSKADLACFNDEGVARTIGAASTPVWTGIGHTGDTSVADMAANYYAITPTELGVHLVQRSSEAYGRRVAEPASRLLDAARDVLDEASQRVQSARREILSTARNRLSAEQRTLQHHSSSMIRAARAVVTASADSLASTRQLFAAYDPQRRLDQGWSIVTGADGSVVKSVDQVAVGDEITVRVSDGTIRTTVNE
mgnify:CR=1 FL=1